MVCASRCSRLGWRGSERWGRRSTVTTTITRMEIAQAGRPGYYEVMETAVRELLIEKRLIEAEEIRRQVEVLDSRTPALGATVVARAWVDPAFKSRLLANGRAACEE